ncbi:MAG TPA: hypothetical protein VM782_12590 [Stellaceae bacterium]|nr:hypothetical protein [Stellaceae bacterium]
MRRDALDEWCKGTITALNMAMCGDADLRALAIERLHLFEEARGRLSADQQKILAADQNGWAMSYPQGCGLRADVPPPLPLQPSVKECLANAGRERLVYLRDYRPSMTSGAATSPAANNPSTGAPSTQLTPVANNPATAGPAAPLTPTADNPAPGSPSAPPTPAASAAPPGASPASPTVGATDRTASQVPAATSPPANSQPAAPLSSQPPAKQTLPANPATTGTIQSAPPQEAETRPSPVAQSPTAPRLVPSAKSPTADLKAVPSPAPQAAIPGIAGIGAIALAAMIVGLWIGGMLQRQRDRRAPKAERDVASSASPWPP